MRRLRLGVPSGLVTALVVLGLSGPAGGPAPVSPGPPPRAVLETRLVGNQTELVRLSLGTLDPVGRPLVMTKGWYPSSQVSPDGRWLVLQKVSNDQAAIAAVRLVDASTLRLRPPVHLGPGSVMDINWTDASHLSLLVDGVVSDATPCCELRLVEVDTATGVAGPGSPVASGVEPMGREAYRD